MTTIHDIDFGRLYREHLAATDRHEKPPGEWDARAAEMSRETDGSGYVDEFVRRMDLSGCTTLLDVGCGPGAIALAVAGRLARVYGLDYSRGMLDALMQNAAARGLCNVEPIERAWEDDWSDVPVCDVVVASRSTLVEDLADALAKLDARANRRVYVTSLVGGRFVHAGILEALGREQPPLPDHIYILNILYQMGRQPRLRLHPERTPPGRRAGPRHPRPPRDVLPGRAERHREGAARGLGPRRRPGASAPRRHPSPLGLHFVGDQDTVNSLRFPSGHPERDRHLHRSSSTMRPGHVPSFGPGGGRPQRRRAPSVPRPCPARSASPPRPT